MNIIHYIVDYTRSNLWVKELDDKVTYNVKMKIADILDHFPPISCIHYIKKGINK